MKIFLTANTDWYLYNFRISLARWLRAAGADVVLVSPDGKFVSDIRKDGFRWIEWSVGRKTTEPLGEFDAVRKLAAVYRREKPDLVHHFTIKPVLYGSLAARLANVPALVNSVTGLGYVFLNQSRKGAALRQVVLPFYRLAFSHRNLAVIFENPNDQQRFIEMGLISEEKTSIVQGVGVDVERFLPLPEPVGTPVVLFPARMLMDKGLGTLIEAARILKETHAVRVVLAGEPDPGNPATVDASTLQAWQDAGLAEWWGFQAEMEAVYPQAAVVTLPSLGEGLPTALIEAAACGRAIVATDVPGCREVVEDGVNGLLVPPNEPVALAHALARLLDDAALRKRMGAAGRQRVMAQFADRLIIAKIVEIYRRLLPVEKARLLISREVDPKGGKNGLP